MTYPVMAASFLLNWIEKNSFRGFEDVESSSDIDAEEDVVFLFMPSSPSWKSNVI